MSYSPELVITQLEKVIAGLEEMTTMGHLVAELQRNANNYEDLIRRHGGTSPQESIDHWRADATRDYALSKDRAYLELALTQRKAAHSLAKAELALLQYRQKVAS